MKRFRIASLGLGLALILSIGFIFGCSDDGSEDDQGGLTVTVLDNPDDKNPQWGVYVILHKADGTVEDSKITGVNGKANFGVIDREQVSITIAFHYDEGWKNGYSDLKLKSYINVPAKDMVIWIEQRKYDDEDEDEEPVANADVEVTGIPAESQSIWLYPMYSYYWDSEETYTFDDVEIYSDDVQSDGKLSLLGYAKSDYQDNYEIIEYGYILDQTIGDENSYTIDLDTSPEIKAFSSDNNVAYISISGNRKGIDYNLGSFYYYYQPTTSGAINVLSQFPVDNYSIICYLLNEESNMYFYERVSELPESFNFTTPDLRISNVAYDDSTRAISWEVSGSKNPDLIFISMNFEDAVWVINNPSSSTMSLNDLKLPDEINSWIDSELYEVEVSLYDYDGVSGFDDAWIEYQKNYFDDINKYYYTSDSWYSEDYYDYYK